MDIFPEWATPGENRRMFGRAKGLRADNLTLSDRDATLGFLEAKEFGNVGETSPTNQLPPPPLAQHGIVEKISTDSASDITNSHREYYDCFHLPLPEDGFIPNHRVRNLMESARHVPKEKVLDFERLKWILKSTLTSMQSWKYPKGGSESKLTDSLLQTICSQVAIFAKDPAIQCRRDNAPIPLQLAKSAKPEHFVVWKESCLLLGSEAKGVEASHFHAMPQAFQICGDSCLNLYREGLKRTDCVAPGLVIAGETIKFIAVYIIADCYPVIVEISPYLSLYSNSGRKSISMWIMALGEFCRETVKLLTLQSSKRAVENIKLEKAFFKPIRNYFKGTNNITILPDLDLSTSRTTLHHMLYLYEILWKTENAKEVVLFPTGVVSIPSESNRFTTSFRKFLTDSIDKRFEGFGDHQPVLVFPFLDGWKNEKPPPSHTAAYVQKLQLVVQVLNSAGIAHMDLRPHNLMWKIGDENELLVQVIDFEDAVCFGEVVNNLDAHKMDARRPVRLDDQRQEVAANANANEWFLKAISDFVCSEEENFSDFMSKSHHRYEEFFL